MYGILKGDEWFTCERFDTRKEAEEWLESEILWYNLVYSNPEYNEVMTNKEFLALFPERQYSVKYRRIGQPFRDLLDERGKK
jgi:hypothetical protein